MKWSVDSVINRMLIGRVIGVIGNVVGSIVIVNGIAIGGFVDAVLVSVSSMLAGEVVAHFTSSSLIS